MTHYLLLVTQVLNKLIKKCFFGFKILELLIVMSQLKSERYVLALQNIQIKT